MGRVPDAPLWAKDQGSTHEHDDEALCHLRITEDAVRLRAYFISLETGGRNPREDWLRAEAEFLAEAGPHYGLPVPFHGPSAAWAGSLYPLWLRHHG